MVIFEITKSFPKRRLIRLPIRFDVPPDRSVRTSPKPGENDATKLAFISKLNDSEGEAAETQTWLEFAVRCGYSNRERAKKLYPEYDEIISILVAMANKPENWILEKGK